MINGSSAQLRSFSVIKLVKSLQTNKLTEKWPAALCNMVTKGKVK